MIEIRARRPDAAAGAHLSREVERNSRPAGKGRRVQARRLTAVGPISARYATESRSRLCDRAGVPHDPRQGRLAAPYEIAMRGQGQQQCVAALQIHPLEGLGVAGLPGLQCDLARPFRFRRPKHMRPAAACSAMRPRPRSTTRKAVAAARHRRAVLRLQQTFPLEKRDALIDSGIGLVNPRGRGSATMKTSKSA